VPPCCSARSVIDLALAAFDPPPPAVRTDERLDQRLVAARLLCRCRHALRRHDQLSPPRRCTRIRMRMVGVSTSRPMRSVIALPPHDLCYVSRSPGRISGDRAINCTHQELAGCGAAAILERRSARSMRRSIMARHADRHRRGRRHARREPTMTVSSNRRHP
jgi:hypothetical protein